MVLNHVTRNHAHPRHALFSPAEYTFTIMHNTGYTKVADVLLDTWMPQLTEAELKTLLTIIRQTTGWNKHQDRISHGQFIKKTGLSRRSITASIESLSNRNFILITNVQGRILTSNERRYRNDIYYQPTNFAKATRVIIKAKSNHIPRQNLPLTIDNIYKQQKTGVRLSEIQKQSDQERIACLHLRGKNLSCPCFRCS